MQYTLDAGLFNSKPKGVFWSLARKATVNKYFGIEHAEADTIPLFFPVDIRKQKEKEFKNCGL